MNSLGVPSGPRLAGEIRDRLVVEVELALSVKKRAVDRALLQALKDVAGLFEFARVAGSSCRKSASRSLAMSPEAGAAS